VGITGERMNNKPWILLDIDLTHGWVIAEEGSPAAMDHTDSGAKGGIIGCSEWMWLDKDKAERIVRLHNEAVARGDYV
jgi:hypothetical protein